MNNIYEEEIADIEKCKKEDAIMKKERESFTCRKTNTAGQRAVDCVEYCAAPLNESCYKDNFNPCTCIVRLGQVCPHFKPGIGTKLYKEVIK